MPMFSTTPAAVRRPGLTPRNVDSGLADWYDALGLDQRAERIRAVFARTAQIGADVAAHHFDLRAAEVAAVYSIVNNTSTPHDAALAFDTARRVADCAPLAADLAGKAQAQAHLDLARSMWREGDALLTELDAVVQQQVAAIAAVVDLVEDIATDNDAVRADAKVQRAWSLALAATDRIDTAWALAFTLRAEDFVARLDEAGEYDWRYRYPDYVIEPRAEQHPVRSMISNIVAGAQPGVVTADEIVARIYAGRTRSGK